MAELERTKQLNEKLHRSVAELNATKVQLQNELADRRKERETLRAKIDAQKAATDQAQLAVEQLNRKIGVLRDENDKLIRSRSSKK